MITHDSVLLSYYLLWSLLVICAVVFLLSGLDDFFFDVYYWISTAKRSWRYRNEKKFTYQTISTLPEKRIAVMVACWHEAGVINSMLRYNVKVIDYQNYDLFVGVYPNDPDTVADVQTMAAESEHVHCIIGEHPGPTSKAKNLNGIYDAIGRYEKEHNIKYDIFVLHDSEDIIHPLSFKFYNYLFPKVDMVQIPVFPLEIGWNYWTHWTYNAEFSEIHTKDILVRERIGGLVPSAGVGTAFSWRAIEMLKEMRNGEPFAVQSLTEDYNTALQLRLHGLKAIFALQSFYTTVWRKRWYFFGKPVKKKEKTYIATRAMFPTEYTKAVRQKTRWILGISFQEWINTGWVGNFSTLYTLVHDRKSIFTHLITGLALITTILWFVYSYYVRDKPQYPGLSDGFHQYPWVWTVIVITSILMLNRIIQRMISVYRVYGFYPAFSVLVTILYGNFINLHALLRAYSTFFYVTKNKTQAKWDKTDHVFPSPNLLAPYRTKLGELLIDAKMINKEQLTEALNLQMRTGEQLGKVLETLGFVDKEKLDDLISKQLEVPTLIKKDIKPLPHSALLHLPLKSYQYMIKHHYYPIYESDKEIYVALDDPTNEVTIKKVIELVKPYKAKFMWMK